MQALRKHRKVCKEVKYKPDVRLCDEPPESALCRVCDAELEPTAFRIRKHYLEYHPENMLKCPQCDMAFGSVPAVQNHMRYYHGENHPCDLCEKVFPLIHHLKVGIVLRRTSSLCMLKTAFAITHETYFFL